MVGVHRICGVSQAVTSENRRASALLGVFESVLYVSSWLILRPEFIGVWFALKTAAGPALWRRDDRKAAIKGVADLQKGLRGRFQAFLIGNALGIMTATFAYGLMLAFVWFLALSYNPATRHRRVWGLAAQTVDSDQAAAAGKLPREFPIILSAQLLTPVGFLVRHHLRQRQHRHDSCRAVLGHLRLLFGYKNKALRECVGECRPHALRGRDPTPRRPPACRPFLGPRPVRPPPPRLGPRRVRERH